MEPGTYTILLEFEAETRVTFGAAGSRDLEPGGYAYTGSAFGPGGLSRVERHRRVLDGQNDARHWHVDYILGAQATTWIGAWISSNRQIECEVAGSLPGRHVAGIGASDCRCDSHLRFHRNSDLLRERLETVHDERFS